MRRPLSPSSPLPLALALSLSLSAGAGCIDDNEAVVFVEPSIAEPRAEVSGGVLGTQLSGSFALRLILGPRASGPSQVSLQSFEVKSADQSTSIVAPLEATTTTPQPVEVAPDSEVTLDLTFDTGADPLPAELRDALCDPAGIRITGTLQDSLQDGATTFASGVFSASCM